MNDKSPLDDDWLDIAKDWQSQSYKEVDTSKLIRSIKWRIIRSKTLFALNLIATISLFVGFFAGLFCSWETPLVAYFGFGAIGSSIFVIYEYKIRSATWKYKQSTPHEVMVSVAQSYTASIAYMNLNLVGFIISLPALNWFIYETVKLDGDSPTTDMFIGNSLVIVMCVVVYVIKRKRVKALAALEQRIAQSQAQA